MLLSSALRSRGLNVCLRRHPLVPYRCMSKDVKSVHKGIHIPRKVTVCIFGLSFAALGLWLLEPSRKQTNKPLSLQRFTSATLSDTEDSGPNSKLLTLAVSSANITKGHWPGPIWSIYVKDNDIQIERPYTPLEGINEKGQMKFWVKRYPHGEVGRWLHSKSQGEKIEIRGPLRTWEWPSGEWETIVMISGGTGLAPFYQLLYDTFNKATPEVPDSTNIVLFHSCRTPAELPPTSLRQNLASWVQRRPEKLKIMMFVDSLNGDDAWEGLHVGRIRRDDIELELRKNGLPLSKVLFLVCGPEPMVSSLAGPRERDQSQGPVGGALGTIGCTSRQVFKL